MAQAGEGNSKAPDKPNVLVIHHSARVTPIFALIGAKLLPRRAVATWLLMKLTALLAATETAYTATPA